MKTQLVGILNVTPDSFSDGGQFVVPAAALEQAERLYDEGAAIIDVGAESTRPHAVPLTPEQEWQRLELILPQLLARHPGGISLDSYHPETVRRAYEIRPVIINDVTGMNNPAMVQTAVELGARVIISHLPGQNIQAAHARAEVNDIESVRDDLLARATELERRGVERSRLILDPGIGFGKTMQLNRQLLEFATYVPDYAVMIGYSRKRFLGEDRMKAGPNLEAGKVAIAAGAAYLRVHDVAAHRALV